jgi:hypothetical protein
MIRKNAVNRKSSKVIINSGSRRILSRKTDRKIMADKEMVAIKDENKDGYIVLKEESLYKPLLIVFGVFLFAMVILFPTSIFDQMVPDFMKFMRLLVNWTFLSSVATLLPLPVSFSDVNLIRVIGDPAQFSNLYVFLMISFIVVSDTFFASSSVE